MELEHRNIPTNGINLHVAFAGPEDGKPVILLHGFPEFWYGWKNQIAPFAAAGYRVIVPDQRGYNLSDKPKGVASYHLDTLAQDIIGLMDVLGYDNTIVVGHDWGAVVAWQLGTMYPERVTKLAILNVPHPAVMMNALRKSLRQLRKSLYVFFFQLPWLPEWVLGANGGLGGVELLKASSKRATFTEEDYDHYREAWAQTGALTGMLNWYRSIFRENIRASFRGSIDLPRVTVPTLMLWGMRDIALGHEMAQPSIALCDEGELVFFENASHWLQHDEPEQVNARLLAFFASPA